MAQIKDVMRAMGECEDNNVETVKNDDQMAADISAIQNKVAAIRTILQKNPLHQEDAEQIVFLAECIEEEMDTLISGAVCVTEDAVIRQVRQTLIRALAEACKDSAYQKPELQKFILDLATSIVEYLR
ncbi:MAG: hypothetical protein Q4C61_11400 [Lachnospiraceae bacterium]|nr:hypothetical protein [Lachnospiraceae bacterium]